MLTAQENNRLWSHVSGGWPRWALGHRCATQASHDDEPVEPPRKTPHGPSAHRDTGREPEHVDTEMIPEGPAAWSQRHREPGKRKGPHFQSTETGSHEHREVSTPPLNIKDNTKQDPRFLDLNRRETLWQNDPGSVWLKDSHSEGVCAQSPGLGGGGDRTGPAVMSPGLCPQSSALESHFTTRSGPWSGVGPFALLSLSFPVCNVGAVAVPASQGF